MSLAAKPSHVGVCYFELWSALSFYWAASG